MESIRGEAGPIGLTLRLTPSFLNSIDQLNVESDEPQVSPQPPSDDADVGAMSNDSTSFTATEQYGEVETGEKLKASNISLISLQIGDYTVRNHPLTYPQLSFSLIEAFTPRKQVIIIYKCIENLKEIIFEMMFFSGDRFRDNFVVTNTYLHACFAKVFF